MANATSPLNTNTKDLDPLVAATGTSSLKRAVGPIAAAGIGDTIANTGVATDVDDAAFTPGTSSVVVIGGLADETATDSVDEGDAGAIRMTLDRRLHVANGNSVVVVSATPTLDTSIYAAGDSLHTAVISFATAVPSGSLSGTIRKMIVVDGDLQSAAGEIWLFSATVTPAAANAAHSISDADAALCIGVIPFGTYYASALNSVSVASPDLPIKCAATTLYGMLVTRGTPTHSASGLTVSLLIVQD